MLVKIVLVQKTGIPTGDPLSSSILEVTLCNKEQDFNNAWKQFPKSIAAGRYADDNISLSYTRCSSCLRDILNQTYGDLVSYECTPPTAIVGETVVQPYLDAELHFNFPGSRYMFATAMRHTLFQAKN